jgi:hypothetical protein
MVALACEHLSVRENFEEGANCRLCWTNIVFDSELFYGLSIYTNVNIYLLITSHLSDISAASHNNPPKQSKDRPEI